MVLTKEFDRSEFDKNGFNEEGFNKTKEQININEAKIAISKNPWNIFHANEELKNNYELIRKCVEIEANTLNMLL